MGAARRWQPVKNRAGRQALPCLELANFDTLVVAYGTPDVYPVYRHQSAYSHTTGAFLIFDDGKPKFTTEPKGGESDIIAEPLWIPVALLQAAAAISPLLVGSPMKPTIDEALGGPAACYPRPSPASTSTATTSDDGCNGRRTTGRSSLPSSRNG